RLQNISDAVTLALGTLEYARKTTVVQNRSWTVGAFTLANAKTLEIQHQAESTTSSNGMGNGGGIDDNIYTVAEFWREN
ncbi:unnamed protein product, partial [marine sediment metagenome]